MFGNCKYQRIFLFRGIPKVECIFLRVFGDDVFKIGSYVRDRFDFHAIGFTFKAKLHAVASSLSRAMRLVRRYFFEQAQFRVKTLWIAFQIGNGNRFVHKSNFVVLRIEDIIRTFLFESDEFVFALFEVFQHKTIEAVKGIGYISRLRFVHQWVVVLLVVRVEHHSHEIIGFRSDSIGDVAFIPQWIEGATSRKYVFEIGYRVALVVILNAITEV